MKIQRQTQQGASETPSIGTDLTRFLNDRFGDGRVILRTSDDHQLVQIGRKLGFITSCGYVTPAGKLLAARCA